MDEQVLAALTRWPNVPAVYGWLSLDRRGHWRLKGELVRHDGLASFISRNYGATEEGEWFFQNGPQRVFAALDYTPWVLRWGGDSGLTCHTDDPATGPISAWIDEDGNVLIGFAAGVGLVCDRDLPALLPCFSAAPRGGADDAPGAVEAFLADPGARALWLHLPSVSLPVTAIRAREVPARFGFKQWPEPRP